MKKTCDVCGAEEGTLEIPGQPASKCMVHTTECIRGAGGWYIDVDDKMARIEMLEGDTP